MTDQQQEMMLQWLGRLVDGELGDADLVELQLLLKEDAAARSLYLQYYDLHARLLLENEPTEPLPQARKSRLKGLATRWWASLPSLVSQTTALSLVLSGVFLCIVLLSLALIVMPRVHNRPAIAEFDRTAFVARVVRTQGALWSDATDVIPGRVTDLYVGQDLELIGGLAEIQFDEGARVLLEAPTTLRIRSEISCDLFAGRLTALVEGEENFVVETISATITDVGTEFGVFADSQDVETRVFDGEVIVEVDRTKATPLQPQRLKAGEALRVSYSPNGSKMERIESASETFVRVRSLGVPEPEADPEPGTLPVTNNLVLWLRADRDVRRGADNRVLAWLDQRVDGNQRLENPRQSNIDKRPLWITRSIGDQPAISFENGSNMATPRLVLGDERTIFVVAKIAVPGTFVLLKGRDGIAMAVPKNGRLGSWLWNRELQKNTSEAVAIFDTEQPFVAALRYDHSNNEMSLLVNGAKVGESVAPTPIADRVSVTLGDPRVRKDQFSGQLAEVLVFDAALSPSDVDAVNRYLLDKYSIQDTN